MPLSNRPEPMFPGLRDLLHEIQSSDERTGLVIVDLERAAATLAPLLAARSMTERAVILAFIEWLAEQNAHSVYSVVDDLDFAGHVVDEYLAAERKGEPERPEHMKHLRPLPWRVGDGSCAVYGCLFHPGTTGERLDRPGNRADGRRSHRP